MSETTENLYSVDPDVLIPLVRGGQINGYPVVDVAHRGGHTYVLCYRAEVDKRGYAEGRAFCTWDIWRHENGKVCAGMGHYDLSLPEGLEDLHSRGSSDRPKLREIAALFTAAADRVR